jgi:flavin reductase (DIM6/NTAB) family NADH-FMN oxidoreductase RutF
VPPEEKFTQAMTGSRQRAERVPLLASALAGFDCLVCECIAASTHDIFICDVLGVLLRRTRRGDPLIYFDGAFLAESAATPAPIDKTGRRPAMNIAVLLKQPSDRRP